MAEKAVSDITDSGKELLEKLSDIEVFKREQQSTVGRVMEDWCCCRWNYGTYGRQCMSTDAQINIVVMHIVT